MTLALWCAIVMLPLQLCACRRHRNLAESMGYENTYAVLPAHIPEFDHDAETQAFTGTVSNAILAPEPTRLRSNKELVPWDLTLQEVVFYALSNAQVIRQSGQFLSPNNALLRSPDGVPTAYDTAIQSSGVLFGQRGYQAALSEFDTQFTTRMLWGNSTTVQNNSSGGINGGDVLSEDSAQFQAVLQRALLTGGQFGLSHTWNYSSNRMPSRLFPSNYEGFLRAEFRQPLWAGAGPRYTSIAGPISENIQGVTGVQQGMLISKINDLIAQIDYEIDVTNFLRDVEMQYWRLYLAIRPTRSSERVWPMRIGFSTSSSPVRMLPEETYRASSRPAMESCRPSSGFWTRSKGSTRTRLSCAISRMCRATRTGPFDRLMFRCWRTFSSTGGTLSVRPCCGAPNSGGRRRPCRALSCSSKRLRIWIARGSTSWPVVSSTGWATICWGRLTRMEPPEAWVVLTVACWLPGNRLERRSGIFTTSRSAIRPRTGQKQRVARHQSNGPSEGPGVRSPG